ncbi:hypothetical protein JG687_00014649 [Phytophthora cactorum]|uniref:DUF6818 domain-containing protein n=3 Tax=Phytophthora cactorum TaxID=29920 RepID=A0A8T1TWG4_9STRA|nr:hypothetical protein JG687_00014649 [Phytophthora cactorum]
MLLWQVAEQIIPLGRNMWEQVAVQYNANRIRTSPERDFEPLRRKSKSLYSKSKPTGSEEVPIRLKAIIWVKGIQMRIEEEGGVHTSHDRLDNGDDDAALEEGVNGASRRGGDDTGRGGAENRGAADDPTGEREELGAKARDGDQRDNGDHGDNGAVVVTDIHENEPASATLAHEGDEASHLASLYDLSNGDSNDEGDSNVSVFMPPNSRIEESSNAQIKSRADESSSASTLGSSSSQQSALELTVDVGHGQGRPTHPTKDSDCRAYAEERCRRAEREELREMERRERAEREQHAKLNWRTQKSKDLKPSKQPENSVKNNVARRQLVRPDSTWIVKKASAASKNDWSLIAKKRGNAMTK